jgi:hypothetical protein
MAGFAQTPDVTIELKKETERSQRMRAQLERLLREYDLSPYIQTTRIVIEEGVIPHSHPVLTIHTRHLGDDLMLLSTFLHEQMHWLVAERDSAEAGAIADFRELYPEVPVGRPDGARDEHSTYLHLIVCDLEYQAMTDLVGREKARETLARIDHYKWIYEQVLDAPQVREVNARWGFTLD